MQRHSIICQPSSCRGLSLSSLDTVQGGLETVTAPPFYQQVAGTVVLCELQLSLSSSLSSLDNMDLSCRTVTSYSLVTEFIVCVVHACSPHCLGQWARPQWSPVL